MDTDDLTSSEEEEGSPEGRPETERGRSQLVRVLKPVAILPSTGKAVDKAVVASRFYNCFNYALLAKEGKGINAAVGVTSANPGEGKTLVASNLAVSLASANQRDTVLIDLNIAAPRLHAIFGTRISPGLVEAIDATVIQVSQTKISHLYVLPSGSVSSNPMTADRITTISKQRPAKYSPSSLGLEHVAAFRDILYSLKQEFEFVVVDMPSIHEPSIPALLTHQMDGIIVVVDTNRTKQEDIRKMFTRVRESEILGFVFNRVTDEFAA